MAFTLNSRLMRGGLGVLNGMADEDLDWILEAGEERVLQADEVLLKEGSRVDAIYFIAKGLFKVFLGAESHLNTLGPGQIVGEMSFIEGRPASANVAAMERSAVLVLQADILTARLNAHPDFAARLYRSLATMTSGRLRELLGTVNRLMEQPPPPSLLASGKSYELAELTQELKQAFLAFEKNGASREEAIRLREALLRYAKDFDRIAGPDSPESPDTREEMGARVQRELLPFLLKSPLAMRLYLKPRGFAGDFETMQIIRTGSGSPLDQVLCELPSLAGIRERDLLVQDFVESSAPAVPGIALLAVSRFGVTLVDFDDHALEFLNGKFEAAGVVARLNPHFLALSVGRFGLEQQQDLVVSGAFADSLETPSLLRFLRGIFKSLAPHGRVVLGFTNAESPDRTFLRYVLNTETVARTEEDVMELFAQSSFGSATPVIHHSANRGTFVAECRL